MPQNLPDDILLELVEVHLSDTSNAQLRDTLCNFSLTSRRFRSFAIRGLYHSLSFRIDLLEAVTRQKMMMTSMIRHYTRAKHLIQSRHLLRNVRKLSLYHWDGNFLENPRLGDWEDVANADGLHLMADDVKKMVEVIYETLTRLVPHMPGLRELRLVECVVTPFLYAAISACPLNLLHVYTDPPANSIHIPTDLPRWQKLHITNLHYRYTFPTLVNTIDGPGEVTDPFVTRILEHSVLRLEELAVDSRLLPMFASYISDKTLSLKSLFVSFPVYRVTGHGTMLQSSAAFSLWSILLASPQLRALIITGIFPKILPPQDLNHHILPNLVDVYAPPYVLRLLQTQGRSLQKVHMSLLLDVNEQPITQLIPCLHTHLLQLSITCARVETVRELLDFIRSLSAFKNLESVDIFYSLIPPFWREYDDIQGASNMVTNLLQGLVYLHTFQIRNIIDPNYLRDSPLLLDPRLLGHPSLKELGVDFCTMIVWYWNERVGWKQDEWEPRWGRNWYDGNQIV